MRISPSFVTALALSLAALAAPRAPLAHGLQKDLEGGTGRVRIRSENRAPRPPEPPRPKPVAREVRVTRKPIVTPTTGTLSVAAESLAEVFVQPVAKGRQRPRTPLKGTVPDGEGVFIFNDLSPGEYAVWAELKGFKQARKAVRISANRPSSVTLNLEPITHDVVIETNVRQGEVRYERSGDSSRVVPIENGRALLKGLRPGKYDVDIRPGEVGYQTLLADIEVGEGNTYFKAELKKQLSKETFSVTWLTLDGWDVPETWRIVSRRLSVNGRGLGLPRDESYRHYADFQLSSDARMVNGVALSFALRAVDKQNYYLVQLTGAQADEPYVLRSFVVKNGAAQRLQPSIPIDGFSTAIKPNQFFNVSVRADDNRFTVAIVDSETGDLFPLGVITDPNRHFAVGAVGIAARDGEHNEIGTFTVCTPECPKGKY